MRIYKRLLVFCMFSAALFFPWSALAVGDWNNSDNTIFSFRIFLPNTGERFLMDERIRLVLEPWGDMEKPRAFVCLTHVGVDYNDIHSVKKKVFKDAYFYHLDDTYIRADLDITNVLPGHYTLWVEFLDEANGEHALGSIDISIIGKASNTGWLLAGDNNMYYLRGGQAVRNTWLLIKNRWFAFDNAGLMYRAWSSIGDNWYYFDDNGGLVYGWVNYLGKTFYAGDLGCIVTGWQRIDGELYYFAASGALLTGEQTIGGNEYVFDEKGRMISGDPNVEITPMATPTPLEAIDEAEFEK